MPSCAQGVNNGRPVTVNGQREPDRTWYRYTKKSETSFTEGVEKSTEFSLHHFSNRVNWTCSWSLLMTFEGQQFSLPPPQRSLVPGAVHS